ncbi:hypothetical protein AKJ43_03380, partial [candidate division MSBL1 archaeon SCGC-AAA261D19]
MAFSQKIILVVTVIGIAFTTSLSIVFLQSPSEEISPVIFEEFDELIIDIDASGNTSCRLTIELPPSSLANSFKIASSLIGTKNMKQGYIESLRESFGGYGWEVRDAECEITGLGTKDNFKVTLAWDAPKMARWEENGWKISSEWVDVKNSAEETISRQKSSWILIRNIAEEQDSQYAQYRVSYKSSLLLPENVGNVYCPLLGSLQTIEYGGGTYSKTSLHAENIDGRTAVVENSLTLIAAENAITITPQQLIENSLFYTINYGGAPPKDISFLSSVERVRLDLKYGRELEDQYLIYSEGSWYSLSPAQVLYYAAWAIDNFNRGANLSIRHPISIALPRTENGDFGSFWRTLSKTDYTNMARQIHENISSNGVAPGVISTPYGGIRFKDALLTFTRILSYYGENEVLPNEIELAPYPSGQLLWSDIETPANYAYFMLSDTHVVTNSPRDNQVLENIYHFSYDDKTYANEICDWIHANIDYILIASTPTSEWVLEHKKGQCRDYANVNLALLRTARMPAKRVNGWIILTEEWQPPPELAPFM